MTTEVGLDLETRGVVDLKKVGVTAYAQDKDTDVYCAVFRRGSDAVGHDILGVPGYKCPDYIVEAAKDPTVIWKAHNAAFERALWRYVLTPRHGWPKCPPRSRWVCTMSQAYAMALPGSLDKCGEALRTTIRKDLEGGKVMKKMMRPNRWSPAGEPIYDHDTPANRKTLREYCAIDTLAEGANGERLMPLLPEEHASWQLDQLINDRGIYVDEELCDAALDVIDKVRADLHSKMAAVTNQAVKKTDQTAALKRWLAGQLGSEDIESIAKGVVEEYLGQQLPGDRWDSETGQVIPGKVRQALLIRQAAAKASAAKIDALLMSRAADMRAHDLFQWHAASTGRWAGRRFQPHNLMRPTLSKKGIKLAIDLIRQHRDPDILNAFFGDDEALSVIGNIVRSLVMAAPGKKLYCGDFSNIEGRGLAWEAREETKLDVFRLNDAKLGPDPYLVAAAAIYGLPLETLTKDSPERQIGKVAELACIAEGSLVLTDRGLVPIERITKGHRVWDGDDFVRHDGVVSRGQKPVIRYGGLTATPDHLVWVESQGEPMPFVDAARRDLPLRYANPDARRVALKDISGLQRRHVYDILNAGPNHRFTVSDVLVHNCGYQGSKGAFYAMAGTYGLVLPEDVVVNAVSGWRAAHPKTVQFWADMEDAAVSAVLSPGEWFNVGDCDNIAFIRSGSFLFMELPSGRRLSYPYPRYEEIQKPWGPGMAVTFMGTDTRNKSPTKGKWTRLSTYGGKLAENCLAADTEVLTGEGWKLIEAVLWTDCIWDGVEWCNHGGVVAKGEQVTGWCRGVRMTPDHLVLTGAGWAQAGAFEWVASGLHEPVFDIVNAGPRQRFTVRGSGGDPIIVHNCTQAIARDVLRDAMFRLEDAGYEIVMHVHDEIVCEVDEGFGSLKEFEAIMAEVPKWAKGFPIKVEGWEGDRYRK